MRPMVLVLGLALLVGDREQGDEAFRRGDFAAAATAYHRAVQAGDTTSEVRYNLGTALLRLERYEDARRILATAAAGAGEVAQRAKYNAANTDLQPAFAGSITGEARRAALLRAARGYRQALLLNPADADARWNLELVQRLLKEDEPPAGGGGGGGGEAEGPPQPAEPAEPELSGAPRPELTPEQADQILAGAEEQERMLHRKRMRRGREPSPPGRDW